MYSPGQAWSQGDELRRLVPVFSLAVAIVAALTDPSSGADLILAALPVAVFAVWTFVREVPLWTVVLVVIAPVVVAQRSGQLEPLLFNVSLLGFVVGRWAPSRASAMSLLVLGLAAPVCASLIQDPAEIAVGIWLLGIAFPWGLGWAARRQRQLSIELDTARRELAEQELLAQRRRVARDVHDFVGHGLAAVMLQVTSARHVLHRDPAAAEEALRSAEDVGRRGMHELRRTVALLRSADEVAVAPSWPLASDIATLVDDARAGGLDVEMRQRGELSRIEASVGAALYRISQEGLANAARHAPHACTVLELEVADAEASLVVESNGPLAAGEAGDAERPRYGLVGMRERASALGGELTAGPTADGWRVSCRLPLRAKDSKLAGGAGPP